MEACWTAVIWGTPLALIATVWLRFAAGPDAPLIGAFWGLLALGLATAIVRPSWVEAEAWRNATLLCLIATGIGHAIVFRPDEAGVLALDGAMIAVALLTLAVLRRYRASAAPRVHTLAAAE